MWQRVSVTQSSSRCRSCEGHVVFDLLQQGIVVEVVVGHACQCALTLLDVLVDPVACRLGRVPVAEDADAYVRAGVVGEEVPYWWGELRVFGELAAYLVVGSPASRAASCG